MSSGDLTPHSAASVASHASRPDSTGELSNPRGARTKGVEGVPELE